jgi:ATP synthase subunit 6
MFSPIEQFDVYPMFSNKLFDYFQVPFTNSALYVFFAFLLFSFFLLFGTYKATLVPNSWQYLLEMLFKFVFKIIEEQAGKRAYKYFPFLFVLFFFVLFINLMGQVPFGFTSTSHVIITFFVSLSIWFGCVYVGLLENGLRWFKFFVPDTIPLFILPFFIVLEMISYTIRAFSLSIRLSANMTAGHTLLHLVATLGIKVFASGFLLLGISFVLLIMVLMLEVAVSFLQAYVFLTLIAVYINDSLNFEH